MTTATDTAAPAGPPGTRKTRDARRTLSRRLRGPQDRNLWFWVFVGPFVLGLLVFVYLPIAWSLLLSFFDARNTVTPTTFVGLGNYADMLSDAAFRSSLLTFVVFAAFIVPTTFALSLGVALLVNRARFARTFFRSVFFLPTACSYVVAALVWKMSIFSGVRFGLANTVLDRLGIEPVAWLSVSQPPWYWLVIVSARLWLQVGFYMILFLAGLQRISPSLYEAAAIDGAQGWKVLRHITVPHCARPRRPCCSCCSSTPSRRSTSSTTCSRARASTRRTRAHRWSTSTTRRSAKGQDFGHGSAGAVILTLLIAVIALAQGRFLRLGQRED